MVFLKVYSLYLTPQSGDMIVLHYPCLVPNGTIRSVLIF